MDEDKSSGGRKKNSSSSGSSPAEERQRVNELECGVREVTGTEMVAWFRGMAGADGGRGGRVDMVDE